MIETLSPRYFAASNSSTGFRNYYGDIFTDARVNRLYIIKGGPGTGKSHFMKAVARHARGRGYRVTEYACSSDPASLDGLLLTKEGSPTLGFVDGTPPHPREPTLPGVKEELIHLGAFWNSGALAESGEEARRLSEAKSAAYSRAYAYLSACGATDAVAEQYVNLCVREDRLQALAERLLRGQPKGSGAPPIPALRRAVSMTGKVCLPTFEREAQLHGGTVVVLEDHYGIAYRVTRVLYEASLSAARGMYVSYDPVYAHKIDGLYYPDSGLCILVGLGDAAISVEDGIPLRSIPLRRLADAEVMRALRGEIRHAVALREELTESALRELATAAKYHFELESIYSKAMDFEAKEAFTESFCAELFRES